MRIHFMLVGLLLTTLANAPRPAAADTANGRHTLTREQIRTLNVRTINELMNQIPGVSAGTSSISIHGSSAVRVFLDGRPINDPLSSRGTVKWELVSLNEIEHIEVYTGGETALYGDDSSGGVVKITTRRMDGDRSTLEVGVGRFRAAQAEAGYQTTLGDWGAGLSLGRDRTDGFRTNNDVDSRTAGVKLGTSLSSGTLDLSADHAREQRGSPGLPEFPTPRARADNRTDGATATYSAGLTATVYVNRFEKRSLDPDIALDSVLESRAVGADLKTEIVAPVLGILKTGANLETAAVSGNRILDRRERRLGVVGSKSLALDDATTLTLGLRLNEYSEFAQANNPELKLERRIGGLSLHAGGARTNNVPTFLQRYTESSTTRPNPDLKMEDVVTWKLGAAWQGDAGLQGGVTLFDSRITDNITYLRGDDGIGSYQNVGRVTQRGAEFSLKWRPAPGWDVKPTHLYLDAFDERSGHTLPFKPRRQTRLDLQRQIAPGWTAGASTQLVSGQYSRADHQAPVAGYAVTSLQTDYALGNHRLLLRIDNLFDRDYRYGDGYPAPPRAWNLSWSRDF